MQPPPLGCLGSQLYPFSEASSPQDSLPGLFPSPKGVWGFFATKVSSHMSTFYMWVLLATERQFSNDVFPAPLCHRPFPAGPADSWLRWEGPWGPGAGHQDSHLQCQAGCPGRGEMTCPRLCRDSAALPSLPDCWEPARAQGCRPASNMHRPARGGNLSSCEGGQRPRGAPVLGRLLCQKRPSGFGVAFSCVCPSAQPHCDCAGHGLPVPCCLGGESVRRGQGLGPALGSPPCCL